MDQIVPAPNANYNALLVSLNHRLSHGITFLANYTWSRCISNTDFGGDVTGPGFMNPANLGQDRASCKRIPCCHQPCEGRRLGRACAGELAAGAAISRFQRRAA
ncbi:MAG TPA: hypothetical protein VK638_02860, partial [Edaphobacter sp.]|nr:hypothetical protein [Edaphobacter sp.]